MHLTGILTTNTQLDIKYVPIVKKKQTSRKPAILITKKKQKNKEIVEHEDTQQIVTDKSISILTEKKHVTDWRNHITIKKRIEGTKKEFIVDTGSPVTITPPEKERNNGKKLLPITKKDTKTLLKTKFNLPETIR